MEKKTKPAKGRGRPAFKPTATQRKNVMIWAAGGIAEASMAKMLGICRDTLRDHFATELEEGGDRERARNLERLDKAAGKGNVTAMKYLDAKYAVTTAGDNFKRKAAEGAAAAPSKLGKKEQAAADAKAPDTNSPLGQLIATRQSTIN
jgi:hypothetical protein